ncbi:MAG TPA: type II toxin-antitoxin system RelE/ParE family toxin [Puia sp.]|nr:type II toxin-antitoxin system RelE/ParE family toxin [Puia sp.]
MKAIARYFETRFLEEAARFVDELDSKAIKKVLYHIDLAEQTNDPKLFKKLQGEIWEFRTSFAGLQIRLLAFWDKTDRMKTLVFATHGFLKKEQRTPAKEIARAENIRRNFFAQKKPRS